MGKCRLPYNFGAVILVGGRLRYNGEVRRFLDSFEQRHSDSIHGEYLGIYGKHSYIGGGNAEVSVEYSTPDPCLGVLFRFCF